MNLRLLVALLLCFGLQPLSAQDYSKDTETIESTMNAILDVISGPAGRSIDWERFRHLFRGDVPFHIRTKRNDQLTIVDLSVEAYVKNVGPRLEGQDFFETARSLTIDRYADIAQVFMVYESKISPDAEPFDKGINSFQLMYDQGRWWVVGLMWQAESSGAPIPRKYMKKKK